MKAYHFGVRGVLLAATLAASLGAAVAADNFTPAGSQATTFGSKDIGGGVQVPKQIPADATGAPLLTTANPGNVNVLALPALPAGSALIGTVNLGTIGGGATAANQAAGNTALAAILTALGSPVQAGGAVSVSNWPGTQPVSAVALPLPTGAATAAKQPAIGTAGTPSADVASVQGVVGGVPQPVDTIVRSAAADRGGTILAGASAVSGVVAGGTGNAVGDVLTLAGGTLSSGGLATQLTVSAVSSGAITGATVSRAGSYTTPPTSPVAVASSSGAGSGSTFTMGFGSIATQFMAANTSRRGITVQNQSSADLYMSCTATATADYHAMRIPAGAFYESPPTHVGTAACSMLGALVGQAFYAREF